MFKETQREPGECSIQHHFTNALRSQVMPNTYSSDQGSCIFLLRKRREYFFLEKRFPRSPGTCTRPQANGICLFPKRCPTAWGSCPSMRQEGPSASLLLCGWGSFTGVSNETWQASSCSCLQLSAPLPQ